MPLNGMSVSMDALLHNFACTSPFSARFREQS